MTERSLFPAFQMSAFRMPKWFTAHGLHKYTPLVTMLRSSWVHWAQAEADGLTNLAPIILMFNSPPAQIKRSVGGHVWHQMRTASTKTNVNRMALRLIGGWSLAEAMEWPVGERMHAKTIVQRGTKSVVLIACRHTQRGEKLIDNYRMANDFQRMGCTIDPTWGRKRLKREHDAVSMKRAMASSDPTPWERPWFCDIDDYSFSLLKSETELTMEGIAQRHCCRSYAQACREGREVVFSIMGPERATLSYDCKYLALQVKAMANKAVLPATKRAAERCINRYFQDEADRVVAAEGKAE